MNRETQGVYDALETGIVCDICDDVVAVGMGNFWLCLADALEMEVYERHPHLLVAGVDWGELSRLFGAMYWRTQGEPIEV